MMKTFLAECRRRRVFRLAGMYVVGCWVVLQVADMAFENWSVSPLAIRYVWIACIVALHAAGMGWADAFMHACSTMGLGGFAAYDSSFAARLRP